MALSVSFNTLLKIKKLLNKMEECSGYLAWIETKFTTFAYIDS